MTLHLQIGLVALSRRMFLCPCSEEPVSEPCSGWRACESRLGWRRGRDMGTGSRPMRWKRRGSQGWQRSGHEGKSWQRQPTSSDEEKQPGAAFNHFSRSAAKQAFRQLLNPDGTSAHERYNDLFARPGRPIENYCYSCNLYP